MSEVILAEIEAKVRDWKAEYDQYAVKAYEAEKLKKIADNTGSILAALMEKAGKEEHKTYYGKVFAKDGQVTLSGHAATFESEKKRGRGRPKKEAEA